jgi:hypothetical protein
MKKLIFSLLLAVLTITTFAQCRIGDTYSEIFSEFSSRDPGVNFSDNGQLYLSVELRIGTVLYYFNSNKICTETVIFPNDDAGVNFYVEQFNKKYVIMSPSSWRMYSNGSYADITLVFYENRYFIVFK